MRPDAHLVALLRLSRLGPRRLARLLQVYGEPEAAWQAVRAGRLDGVPLHVAGDKRPALLSTWRAEAAAVDVDSILDEHVRAGVTILTPAHPDWPASFVDDPEPPPLVFVKGDPGKLSAPSVAIVGTRRCTAAGTVVARELGRDLAAAGLGVVSGLALGIDAAAHRGCLDLDAGGAGPPVGVVATGLDVLYPRRHVGLANRVADRGVLLSEAPLGRTAERWRFPARNRLIAGLAMAVVVVESRRHGGSMLTVDSAVERGVEVLAVPGPVRSPASDGPNQLIHEGCGLVRDATDVLTALGTRVPSPGQLALGPEPGPDVDDPVADAVSWPPSSLDAIVAATGLPFTEVASRLAALELAGVVERVADGYQRAVAAR